MSLVITQDLDTEAEKLLQDIGSRYGTLKHNEDGSYDMETCSGVHIHYENAIEGCKDWRKYILNVVADDPEAYEPEQLEVLELINELY